MATTQTATSYRLADEADVRKLLKNYPTSVKSLDPVPGAAPHPGLNGQRVVLRPEDRVTPEDHAIYFVWRDGVKCMIPDRPTFEDLFAAASGTLWLSRRELDQITTGEALTPGAVIIKSKGRDSQYLISNGEKHLIASMEVKKYCTFQHAQEVPAIIPDFIPKGFDIDYGA